MRPPSPQDNADTMQMHLKELFPRISVAMEENRKQPKVRKLLRIYCEVIRDVLADRNKSHLVKDLPEYIHSDYWRGIIDTCQLKDYGDGNAERGAAADTDVTDILNKINACCLDVRDRCISVKATAPYKSPSLDDWTAISAELQKAQEHAKRITLS